MVVSLNYSLIPYPGHHYPVQPLISENAVIHRDAGQESIGRRSRFRHPCSEMKVSSIHFDVPGNRYDIRRCLHYSDADQVGRLIDIYA